MGQKTIYVKDEVRWEEVKEAALKLDMGIGEYLLRWDKIQGEPKEGGNSQLDRIEAMLDRLVPEKRGTPIYGNGVSSNKITLEDHGLSDPKVFEPVSGESIKEKKISAVKGNIRDDDEILKDAKKNLDRVTKMFNPQPKGGKK